MKSILRVMLLLGMMFFVIQPAAQNVKTFIPDRAYDHLPTLNHEISRLMPYLDYPEYFGGLIEHESCLSLTHSRCWSSTSELKTAREQGVGLGQITRAFHPDGRLRFDTLSELRQKHMSELKELSWANVKQRPDLQMKGVILLIRDNYNALYDSANQFEQLAFADASYNGGLGGLRKEIRACGLAAGCDPERWFDHVEKYCLKSKAPLYGTRSACDINRNHVRDVMLTRMEKYKPHLYVPKIYLDLGSPDDWFDVQFSHDF